MFDGEDVRYKLTALKVIVVERCSNDGSEQMVIVMSVAVREDMDHIRGSSVQARFRLGLSNLTLGDKKSCAKK